MGSEMCIRDRIDGAKCIGFNDLVGSIENGKRADIILVDLRKINLTPILLKPIRNIAFNLVYSANGSEVEYVIIDGEVLVESGKCTRIDEEKVIEEAQRAAEELADKGYEGYVKSNPLIMKYMREELI